MLKMALLAGARPQVCDNGPVVRLKKGWWKVKSEGVVNSVLRLRIHSSPKDEVSLENHIFEADGTNVQVILEQRGSESHISVHAEYHGELRPSSNEGQSS